MHVLSLDGGSSSLKFGWYEMDGEACRTIAAGTRADLGAVLESLPSRPDAVGHRIVFGGPERFAPTRAGDDVLQELEGFVAFDPLHLRSQLDMVREVGRRFDGIAQVLCFDTAFHRAMPAIARRFPLPKDVPPLVRRYGFHGLSYESILWRCEEARHGRVVIAHLGGGASLCALRDGEPRDTTMGFSPLGGLMMGTRPGDLDPGVLLYLLGPGGYAPDRLGVFLNRHCGLLGVSGSSADMRTLLAARFHDSAARDAVELFVYVLVKHLGAMIAVLGGIDELIFTGGIGENAAPIRAMLCAAFDHAGMRIDDAANKRGEQIISSSRSGIRVRLVAADESLMIARHTAALSPGCPARRQSD